MAKYPGDLESSYSETFSKLIENINRQYIAEVRKALKSEGVERAAVQNALRYNASSNYQRMLKRLKEIREKLFNKTLFKRTLESMNNVMGRMSSRIENNIKKQFKKKKFPVPSLDLQADSAVLQTAVQDNVSLITRITEEQSRKLEQAVLKSMTGGSSPDTIIKEVESMSDKGRNYAEFVARDQIAKTHGALNKEAQTMAGFPGYIWTITNDGRVREDHREQAGKYFTWDNPPLLDNGNLHPGEDFQCRCIAVPSFGPEDEEGI
jgi:SPP1 gp7 family putative phage head morphogenesis protein